MNTFGQHIRLTTFGESHGAAIGGVLDGFPAGMTIDFEALQRDVERRAGCNKFTSSRAQNEADEIEWLSGIYEGKTLGTPIAFVVRNSDVRSGDYQSITEAFRPGHADYTYQQKYGIRDPRGGGRSSARETLVRVVAGALAKQYLASKGITISAQVSQIGNAIEPIEMQHVLEATQRAGDSIGGIVSCVVHGLPAGVGEPIYDKLSARLAYAMLSINACKGFDFGSGFEGVTETGSALNDEMQDGAFLSNHAGGILGGISTGQDIYFRCVFKPTPSIAQPQRTIDTKGKNITIEVKGRHDVCVALRSPAIVEAMTALVVMDLLPKRYFM